LRSPNCDVRLGVCHGVVLLVLNVDVVFSVVKDAKRAFLVNVSRTHTAFIAPPHPRVDSSGGNCRGKFRSARTRGESEGFRGDVGVRLAATLAQEPKSQLIGSPRIAESGPGDARDVQYFTL
ncbi:hypothetical protein EDB89DRAFT_1945529, partial [Lactarius sanguifluus]